MISARLNRQMQRFVYLCFNERPLRHIDGLRGCKVKHKIPNLPLAMMHADSGLLPPGCELQHQVTQNQQMTAKFLIQPPSQRHTL